MAPIRILIAVHGHEPEGWAHEVPRALAAQGLATHRVLAVFEAPPVAFTSLLPAARRRFDTALAAARRADQDRVAATVAELLAGLPSQPDVLKLRCARLDPGRSIVDHASQWSADVVIVGRDVRSRLHRTVLGTVHERVVRLASCAVLVTPAPAPSAVVRLHRVRRIGPATSAEGHA